MFVLAGPGSDSAHKVHRLSFSRNVQGHSSLMKMYTQIICPVNQYVNNVIHKQVCIPCVQNSDGINFG